MLGDIHCELKPFDFKIKLITSSDGHFIKINQLLAIINSPYILALKNLIILLPFGGLAIATPTNIQTPLPTTNINIALTPNLPSLLLSQPQLNNPNFITLTIIALPIRYINQLRSIRHKDILPTFHIINPQSHTTHQVPEDVGVWAGLRVLFNLPQTGVEV